MTKHLLVIAGPTASGKTTTAIQAAKHWNCSVVSADSRQFYHEMKIGTARPDLSDLGEVPHFFLAYRSIFESVTVADYADEALQKISELHNQNDLVILSGGSGLYIDAVCDGIDEIPDVPSEIREALNLEFDQYGILPLQQELLLRDPDMYENIDLQNHRRLIRALEICRSTGKPFSSLRQGKKAERPFNIIRTALLWERDELYDRINDRVDQMFKDGLIEEVRSLIPYQNLNSLHTVGYTELFRFFRAELKEQEAKDLIKQNTRRYAKRQMTWFRKNKDYHWYYYNQLQELIDFVDKSIKRKSDP